MVLVVSCLSRLPYYIKCFGIPIIASGLLVVSLVGCGERIESTSYYYTPGWTQAGDVIFVKGLQSVRKDAIGTQIGSTYTESVMTTTAAGAGESLLFDATDAPPIAVTCSPAGTAYAAYLNELSGGLYGKIVIRNVAAGTHTGLEKTELSFSPGIKSFDWSNDAAKLVYCTTREVRTINLDGTGDTLVTAESNLKFVSWRYGGRIAFVHTSEAGTLLSMIYPSGGRTNLAVAASVDKPQISSANTSEVYGLAGGSYCMVDVSAGTPATTEVLSNFGGQLPRLSPDASKVVYDKSGESSGIYILDVAAKTEAKIK